MSHKDKSWFIRASEFNGKFNETYAYGIQTIKHQLKKYYDTGYDRVTPYNKDYRPNPFQYQYDLTMHIWLKYFDILKNEIKILRSQKRDDEADEMSHTKTLYGISRTDFLFAAADMRWPTRVMEDGSHHGSFIRDPWAERRVQAASDEHIKYVFSFGGGGQGKTQVSLAMSLMLFDHFIFTEKGARCMISTTNEDKLNSVGWSYLCNLLRSTNPGISRYAGKANIAGNFTLRRPKTKDSAGVFKGILIGNSINDQNIIDKLTGTHGHPFMCYILDEAQSTPSAPMKAAPNFTMHAGDYRIFGAGNWGENNDTLAKNVCPDNGWDSVDQTTGRWISTTENGAKAIVLHFNNNLSPGMTEEGHRLFPHMPSRKILEKNYPTEDSRNPDKNLAYRRFWIGWRVEALSMKNVIYHQMIRDNLADQPLDFVDNEVLHNFGAFDSAQAEIDRNILLRCQEGICKITKQRVFGPKQIHPLKKSTDSLRYYMESSDQIFDICKNHNIESGALILDWTGRPAHAEKLAERGMRTVRLVYNKAIPDGIRRDDTIKRVLPAIPLNVQLDFKSDIPQDRICAHHVAENQISLAAWLLREYIKVGRVRNISQSLLDAINNQRSIEDELYNREFYLKPSAKYGDRFMLERKSDFIKKYGFSPDLLDTLFESAYYMFFERKLPLTPVADDDIVPTSTRYHQEEEHQEVADMWASDDIFAIDGL